MLPLILFSVELILVWVLCLAYAEAMIGKISMAIPAILLAIITVITISIFIYEYCAYRNRR